MRLEILFRRTNFQQSYRRHLRESQQRSTEGKSVSVGYFSLMFVFLLQKQFRH